MTVGTRYYTPNQFEFDSNGVPLVGGQLFFYDSGTSTAATTWSDVNLTVANTNPIVADGNGRFGSIFLSPTQAYKIALYTAIPAGTSQSNSTPASPLGTQIWTQDPCGPAAGGATSSSVGIIGEVRAFAGITSAVPAQWYLCYGQAVSRTAYSAAFAVIGTSWGSGDGSTTFNLPDLRGRVIIGLDNMGGTAAGRITSGVCGIAGTTLGGTGGSQLAQADSITVSLTVTDPGHHHTYIVASGSGVVGGGINSNSGNSYGTLVTGNSYTGLSVGASATGTNTGASQNVQPGGMANWIIYLGA